MRLFGYYALHTFKNQLKKLFKTWVVIFILACMLLGGIVGVIAASVAEHVDEGKEEADVEEIIEEAAPDDGMTEEESLMRKYDMVELIGGAVILGLIIFMAYKADTSGSKIFLPADVNLLFTSPMKPQSVLMFRLTTQLGAAIVGSIYLLFQLPNLIFNLGISLFGAFAVIAAWILALVISTLIQVLIYALASTHTEIKKYIRPVIYAICFILAGGFALSIRRNSGSDASSYLSSAFAFFNGKATRFIPFWGWIKGFMRFSIEGNIVPAAILFVLTVLGAVALLMVIRRLKPDFYEDAMAKSEETAKLLEASSSEKTTNIVKQRKKDRSDKLKRDGMNRGCGANVFFYKNMYNRFRFAHLGFFTKTMETYLAAALIVGALSRFVFELNSVVIVALALAVMSFFRAMGNPLEEDTNMDYFMLIPEKTTAKLFYSLLGNAVSCFLDLLIPLVAGALMAGANPFSALLWVFFILSVNLYATTVGAFIAHSVPVSAGKTIKQIVQIMFIYFGLIPDIAIIAIAFIADHLFIGIIVAAVLNLGLCTAFFFLTAVFLEPKGGNMKYTFI